MKEQAKMKNWNFAIMLLAIIVSISLLSVGSFALCMLDGYVFTPDNSPVKSSTSLTLYLEEYGISYPLKTGVGWPYSNYFLQVFRCSPGSKVKVIVNMDNYKAEKELIMDKPQKQVNLTLIEAKSHNSSKDEEYEDKNENNSKEEKSSTSGSGSINNRNTGYSSGNTELNKLSNKELLNKTDTKAGKETGASCNTEGCYNSYNGELKEILSKSLNTIRVSATNSSEINVTENDVIELFRYDLGLNTKRYFIKLYNISECTTGSCYATFIVSDGKSLQKLGLYENTDIAIDFNNDGFAETTIFLGDIEIENTEIAYEKENKSKAAKEKQEDNAEIEHNKSSKTGKSSSAKATIKIKTELPSKELYASLRGKNTRKTEDLKKKKIEQPLMDGNYNAAKITIGKKGNSRLPWLSIAAAIVVAALSFLLALKRKRGKAFLYAITLLIIYSFLATESYAACNVQGYIYYHNGTAVPAGTNVNITNQNTGQTIGTTTGFGDDNFYFQSFATCTQDPPDTFYVYTWINSYEHGEGSGLAAGTVWINVTFINNAPEFNATLPEKAMNEDNTTGIDNAISLDNYVYDYEGSSLSYSIYSQSNSTLVNASIDGSYVDISAPGANLSGISEVCIRAYDGENYSSPGCFNITIAPVQDLPVFSSLSENTSNVMKSGVTVVMSASAYDVDNDMLSLYVCTTPSVSSSGCTGTELCSASSLSSPNCSFVVQSTDQQHRWYAYIYDNASNEAEANFSGSYYSDYSAPSQGTVAIESGNAYSNSTTLSFSWSGFSDNVSGIKYYYYSFTNSSGSRVSSYVQNTSSSAQLSGASEGTNTVYVWAEDNVGNIGYAASDSIIVDTEEPVLSSWTESISDITEYTTSPLIVTVTVNDTTFNTSNPLKIRYKFGSSSWSSWQNMSLKSSSSSGYIYNYSFDLSWDSHTEEWFYYQVTAEDMLQHNTTEQQSEYIEMGNYAPSFVGLTDQSATEDTNMSFIITASDADNDNLSFSCSLSNITITEINSTSSLVWWVPSNHYVGDNSVRFSVTDGTETVNQTITISVSGVNDAPVLSEIGSLSAYLHEPFVHYIYAYDPDNQNSVDSDNDSLVFGNNNGLSWFKIYSRFNSSSSSYYGVINFTPLLSHKGGRNVTIYVSDGAATDTETISFVVGYCGDKDSAGEPRCDSTYEDCSTCPQDCGLCTNQTTNKMAIITNNRNCLGQNFSITVYELYQRATCDKEGIIIDDRETCGTLEGVYITVYYLNGNSWEDIDQYITDSNGTVSFIPTTIGEYKIVAKKTDYEQATKYLEINKCLQLKKEEESTEESTQASASKETGSQETKKETQGQQETEKKSSIEEPKETGNTEVIETEERSLLSIIVAYVIIPLMLIILITGSYYYYEANKDNVAWILKLRIASLVARNKLKEKTKHYWKKIKEFAGF